LLCTGSTGAVPLSRWWAVFRPQKCPSG